MKAWFPHNLLPDRDESPDAQPAPFSAIVPWVPPAPVPEAPPQADWQFGPSDVGLAAASLALTVVLCVPFALHFRAQAAHMERERQRSIDRGRVMAQTVEHAEAQRIALLQFRRDAAQYLDDVETRPMIPWTTVMTELSRRRPQGVWTTRISGDGPRFRAIIATPRAELATAYARRLMESPYIDFAAQPGGQYGAASNQIVGRMRGE
jgi:hypothetical protein